MFCYYLPILVDAFLSCGGGDLTGLRVAMTSEPARRGMFGFRHRGGAIFFQKKNMPCAGNIFQLLNVDKMRHSTKSIHCAMWV
jgi:hypothetical protein